MRSRNRFFKMSGLFLGNFAVLFTGFGLFPLLPVYASELGASRAFIGVFYAIIFAANTAGSMATGFLAGKLTRKTMFVGSSVLGIPALVLLGLTHVLWQVVVLTSLIWFSGGVILSLIKIYTGLITDGKSLGRSYSLLSLSIPIGSLLGGMTISQVLARSGYVWMFFALAAVWSILPALGMLLGDPKSGSKTDSDRSSSVSGSSKFGANFNMLLVVALVSATAISISRLGTPLSMQALDFPSSEIANSATISGLIAIPAMLLVGIFSERKRPAFFLAMGYALAAGGAMTLSSSTQLWQFWLAAALMMLAYCLNGAMLSALATKILHPSALSRGLPWVTSSTAMASILSFGSTGFIMDSWGPGMLFAGASILSLAALLELYMLYSKLGSGPNHPSQGTR